MDSLFYLLKIYKFSLYQFGKLSELFHPKLSEPFISEQMI